ncbi:unnamed protein product [Cyprideis torosa]|uniref:Uncharacterized protein n=1 Tax=Cyprideis torosa TaxID=163714 RepID=A0A7R8ZKL2_9CRUS|nr:unnamed protein product [Cyprideis torosa]CAG0884682.1 unnamed protein product [Cyprideis torosa]
MFSRCQKLWLSTSLLTLILGCFFTLAFGDGGVETNEDMDTEGGTAAPPIPTDNDLDYYYSSDGTSNDEDVGFGIFVRLLGNGGFGRFGHHRWFNPGSWIRSTRRRR